MMSDHIINLIESAPLASLSSSDLTAIRRHTDDCVNCRQAFEAAQISMLLLRERAAETFEPSPFFHTRVLATLRERQTAGGQWAWSRVWGAAGALASSLVLTVAALAALTFIPGNQATSGPQETTVLNSYSLEDVLLDRGESLSVQVSEAKVLITLSGDDDEAA